MTHIEREPMPTRTEYDLRFQQSHGHRLKMDYSEISQTTIPKTLSNKAYYWKDHLDQRARRSLQIKYLERWLSNVFYPELFKGNLKVLHYGELKLESKNPR